MNRETQNEIWQVEVGGQVYEAPLAELPEWIGEGSLLPADKVRKGNLRWIEARKVPALIPFFNAREKGEPMPVVQSVTDASAEPEVPGQSAVEPANGEESSDKLSTASAEPAGPQLPAKTLRGAAVPGYCVNHDDRPAAYVCSSCGLEFCKACPTSYGGNVRICPDCGALCRTAGEAAQKARQDASGSGVGSEAFGFADLGRAFAHPFQFKPSLIFGGLMYMFFSVGSSAWSMGGILLIGAALICWMLSNMLTFGIRANVIDNFTKGRLDTDFMPSFDDFSLWDDVVHPFFLSIGVHISSFGPFFLVAIIGAYLILSAAGEQMKKFNDELTSIPGTELYAPDRTAEQSKEVREVLDKIKQHNESRVADQKQVMESAETGTIPPETATTSPAAADQEKEKLDNLLQEIRTRQLEREAPSAQTDDKAARYTAVLSSILHLAAPLVVFGMITLLWGLFYYPAACAVAGYTRSFMATINPLVGLDTIRRLGVDYVKILFMAFLLSIVAGVIGTALELLLSPFDLPRVGNLPAAVLGGFAAFYFSIVFSCLLGYALLKSADRLKLPR